MAPAYALKVQMKEEIEKNLDDWIKQTDAGRRALDELYGRRGNKEKKSKKDKKSKTTQSMVSKEYGHTKVADIVFSFNNAKLIAALRARGGAIAAQDFDQMRAEEEKINELFQEFDELTIPTTAFITFESDDSANLALDVCETSERHKIIGQEMKFIKPSEPTDIIWENRHYTPFDYLLRQLWAALIVGVLLFVSLIVIYAISAYSMKLAAVYPPTNCDSIDAAYGAEIQTYAVADYDYIQANPGQPSSGCLQCFCQDQAKADKDNYLKNSYG